MKVALSNFADLAKTAIEEGIDIISSGAGLPLSLSSFLKGFKEIINTQIHEYDLAAMTEVSL